VTPASSAAIRSGPLRIAFAGGGSGGHLSPALAVAERLRQRQAAVEILVLCSQRPIDAEVLSAAGLRFEALPSAAASLRPSRLPAFLRSQWQGVRQAMAILGRERPDAVVAVGGYASVPGAVAARRLSIPLLLVNLDARPGLANRLVAAIADEVLAAVPTPDRPGFARRLVGPVLRRDARAEHDAAACRLELGLRPELPTLLVTGASQGSTSFDRLMARWIATEPGLFEGWQVLHLGAADPLAMRARYAEAGVAATVEAFLHRMGAAWGAASLAISRGGANSVAEAHANAVPTVFVPYPHHRDRHQALNAAPLAAIGGAVVVEDRIDPDRNLATIAAAARALLLDPPRRRRMQSALRASPPADGAAAIAAAVLQLAGGRPD
jgi:UDP-N-acetylglucosamine--N-acetylmuramyl-(pentapeptide) pyrophosphoryl-undecaprenol N-acetylglucosamine transferase